MRLKESEPKLSMKDRLWIAGAAGAVVLACLLTEIFDGPVPTIVNSHSCELRDAPAEGEHLEEMKGDPGRYKGLQTCTVNDRQYAIRLNPEPK